MTLTADNVMIVRGRKTILKNLSLTARAGEMLALIGPNGAGKSTLLHALAGTQAVSRGVVTLDGVALHKHDQRQLARRRAMLAQSFAPGFAMPALDVVLIGRSPHEWHSSAAENRRASAAAMREMDVLHLIRRNYATLSGGERQRIQIARVLAQIWPREDDWGGDETRFLLLDEPTNNLDLQHQHTIMRTVRQLADRGAGVIIIVHDPNLAGHYADRICIVHHGQLYKIGTPAQVLHADMMKTVFGVDVQPLYVPPVGQPWFIPKIETNIAQHQNTDLYHA